MDFVKKHYEKILLSVVLLGLVGALVFLPFLIIQRPGRGAANEGRNLSRAGRPAAGSGFDAGNECVGAAAIALQTGFFDDEQTVQSASMAKKTGWNPH
jgi:hypothetical protein